MSKQNTPEDVIQLFKSSGLLSALDVIAQEESSADLCSRVVFLASQSNHAELVKSLIDKVDFQTDDGFSSLAEALTNNSDEVFDIIYAHAPENVKSYALGVATLYNPYSSHIEKLIKDVSCPELLEDIAISAMSTTNKSLAKQLIEKINDQDCLHRLFTYACQGKSLYMTWILPRLENPKINIIKNTLSACESLSEPSLLLLMPHISKEDEVKIFQLMPKKGMWSKHERLFNSIKQEHLKINDMASIKSPSFSPI